MMEDRALTGEAGDSLLLEKVRGCLYGVAIGDAMGAPAEWKMPPQIRERYGEIVDFVEPWDGPSDIGKGDGRFTDDTHMTWVLMRLRLANADPRLGGVGNMVNCGAAMYASPVGIVNACDPVNAYREAIEVFSAHQWSYGLEAAAVMAACVAEAFRPTATVDSVVGIALDLAKEGTQRAIEAVPVAIGFLIVANGDFEQSIFGAANYGRDNDSIAGMAGGIAGALHGDGVIRPEWIAQVNAANKVDLDPLARDLTS